MKVSKEEAKQYFALYAEHSEEYRKRINEAEWIIEDALIRNPNKSLIAFSGGKDSLVMMHLVRGVNKRLNKDILVIHWDYGRTYIPIEIHNKIIEIVNRYKPYIVETSILYDKLKDKAINILGTEYLGKLMPKLYNDGYVDCFVGLRSQESCKRRLRIANHRSITKQAEIFPVGNFNWEDIWGYIFENNLGYLNCYYDVYCPIVGWDKTRFTTLFDKEFDKFGSSNIDNVLMWRYLNEKK